MLITTTNREITGTKGEVFHLIGEVIPLNEEVTPRKEIIKSASVHREVPGITVVGTILTIEILS